MPSLSIHDVAFGGAGVARHEGKVWFVPFTIAGETVAAQAVRAKKKFVQAELIEIETASPHRVSAPCPYYQRCGGCAYQHIDYAEQLRLKTAQVEQTLRRLGRMETVPMRPIIAAPEPYRYRNRLRMHAAGGVIGFYAHGGYALVDIAECLLATPAVNDALAHLRRARVADGDYTVSPPHRPSYFEQTNDAVARLLVEAVRALLPARLGLLIDAYCGAGLFARELRDLFDEVIGIEENPFAVEQARQGASPGERYLGGDVAARLGELLSFRAAAETAVLLDPPAAGVAPRVVELLCGSPPGELVYVSCNPATLARDLAPLLSGPFRVNSVTPVDMFPQTAEIEVIAHLQRKY